MGHLILDGSAYPSSQVFGDQRHQQAGWCQQRAPLRNKVHLHQTHLAVETSQSQGVHLGTHTLQRHNIWAKFNLKKNIGSYWCSTQNLTTHPGVASEEPIRDGNVDVKRKRLQNAGLHVDELLPFVRIVTNVKEIFNSRWAALLIRRRWKNDGTGLSFAASAQLKLSTNATLTSNLEAISMVVEPTSCSICLWMGVSDR